MMLSISRLCQNSHRLSRIGNSTCCNYHPWLITRNSQIKQNGNVHWRYFRGNSRGQTGRSRGSRLAPEEQNEFKFEGSRLRTLFRPTVFTAAFACSCFVGAAAWQYETARMYGFTSNSSFISSKIQELFRNYEKIPGRKDTKFTFEQYWIGLSEGKCLALKIIAVNVAIFLMWKVPRFNSTMMKYFCSNPAAKVACWPMLLSTASHYSAWHLGLNMYVLYNFSDSLVHVLGKEQFLALYLSAGVVASLASYLKKVALLSSGLSLGASGCLMGAIGFFCMQYPQAQLQIVFLPMFPFTAASALKGIIALDTIGLVLRWKLMDHAAHLGGVFFGISYAIWGREYIWHPIQKWWHKVRTT